MKKAWAWLAIPWALFIAAAIGWVVYWHIVAGTAETRLNALIADQQAQGARAEIMRIERHGFPMLLWLELHGARYAPARGGWDATAEQLDLHINLLNTNHVTLRAPAPIMVRRANGAATRITSESMIASWRTTANGALAQAGLEANALTLDDPESAGVLRAGRAMLSLRPDPRNGQEYQLALDVEALALPRPVRSFETFGQDVAALRAAIVIEHGAALLEASESDPLGPWRAAGGRLRFEALTLNWGPLEATGAGYGGLDAERRLQGALELPIERPAPVLQAIAQSENMDESARRALGLLAAGYTFSGDDLTLDVEAQNGWLRLEGLSVRPLPPVY